jgi:uncharacterized protein YdeI (YjbR/CyaY-like superfamily)
MKDSPNVDEYIAKAADFAQPILLHLRNLVHQACPDVKETIKWGFPCFELKGIFCCMAAFKNHCTFTFWKASVMQDAHKIFSVVGNTAMGQLGKIRQLADLPSEAILLDYLKEAVQLNEKGIKVKDNKKTTQNKELEIPDYFKEALQENEKAKNNFDAFSFSNKKEYINWLIEAKSEETLHKRMTTAIEWISEGKGKNWKYKK